MTGKLHLSLSIGWANDERTREVELPDDWSEMDDAERDAWCEEELDEFVSDHLDTSYAVVEEAS